MLSTEEVSKQFVNDVELIKQLDHPNILKVHEVYQDQFYFYVVEEFCEGQVLIDYITKHKKSMTEREIGTSNFITTKFAILPKIKALHHYSKDQRQL